MLHRAEAQDPAGRPGRRRVLPLSAVVVGVSAALVLLVAVLAGARAGLAAAEARSALVRAVDAPPAEADVLLAHSRSELQRARALLAAPVPAFVSRLPLVGRSWAVERVLVETGLVAVDVAASLRRTAIEVEVDGALDPVALRGLSAEARRAETLLSGTLAVLVDTEVAGTPAPVQRAHEGALRALLEAKRGTAAVAAGGDLAASLVGGPTRTMLIALQNNAELRGTGGYVSTFALARLGEGRIEVGPFRDVLPVADYPSTARRVPAPPSYVEDYGPFLADTTLWRNWTMSPDVPVSASVGARAGSVLLGQRLDLVLMLDVPALSALLALDREGVVVAGRHVPAQDLVDALLQTSYDAAGVRRADQDARRAALRAEAGRVVQRLLSGGVDAASVARTGGGLASGRHVALWSAAPHEQDLIDRLGLSGSIDLAAPDDDSVLVTLNNLGASKLDYYVDRKVHVQATLAAAGADVVQRVSLQNRAPLDLVPYVAGEVTPGTARERIELSLGPRAQVKHVLLDGEQVEHEVRADAQRTRVVLYALVPRGAPVLVEVAYSLRRDDDVHRLQLLPQPLARPAHLTVQLRAAPGSVLQAGRRRSHELRGSGPFDRQERLQVAVRPETRWEALRRWWAEPVDLPV